MGLGRGAIIVAVVTTTLIIAFLFLPQLNEVIDRIAVQRQLKLTDTETLSKLLPRDTFEDCSGIEYCPTMVVVPVGSFQMGDGGFYPNASELPVTKIQISSSFAMSKFEITQAQWRACEKLSNPDSGVGCSIKTSVDSFDPNLPISHVNWCHSALNSRTLVSKSLMISVRSCAVCSWTVFLIPGLCL
ncbi:SUMF1/EgtB/PvdO family nonheme iron enzyme [uncultured Roseobacter sp.]|uniref:formylglycine-generating enzyme family protein n=1 Tax=uncultured Roseobacter sp. TaxID=114847 RepID=UPI0034534954